MKTYKVFSDETLIERGFQFVPGKLHKIEGDVVLCKWGFHACNRLIDCFKYKIFHLSMRVFEVSQTEAIIKEGDKIVSSKIKLLRELPMWEVDKIVNNGKYNLGYGNKGNYNKGNYNKGSSNKGNYNEGYNNKGDYNEGNSNKGDYNEGSYNEGNSNTGNYNKGDYNGHA